MDHRPDTNSAAGTLTEQPLAVPGLGILRVQGKDAGSFLQGQLCNDVRLLHPQQGQLPFIFQELYDFLKASKDKTAKQ